jgi:hypothetical protein
MYSEKNILNLFCLDKNGKTVFEKNDLIKNKKIEEFIELELGRFEISLRSGNYFLELKL